MRIDGLKAVVLAVALVTGSNAGATLSFEGSISFNPRFTLPAGTTLDTATLLTPVKKSTMVVGDASGMYNTLGISADDVVNNWVFNPNSGTAFDLRGPQSWQVWSCTFTSGGSTYRYYLTSDSFSYTASATTVGSQVNRFLNVSGDGVAHIADLSGTDVYASPATWSLTGTQSGTGTVSWGLSTTAVPEPSTVVAGGLLLVPLGVSAMRVLRRSRGGEVTRF